MPHWLVGDPGEIDSMTDELKLLLEDLESRIDVDQETRLRDEWAAFYDGKFDGDIFSPTRDTPAPSDLEWPKIRINDTLEDFDAMALQQYGGCSNTLASGGGAPLAVRCNYGTSIIPLLFGVRPFIMPEEMNTLPTSHPLHDLDAIRRLIDAGVPDLDLGYGARVFEMAERYLAIASEFSKIGEWAPIYHPDTQGPLDICEVVWGSELFTDMLMEPDLVHEFLALVTETYIAFMRRWERLVPFDVDLNAHWNLYHRGALMLRDDSSMNVTPAMFDEFVVPYNQRLLDEFGGGAIHFCGRGDHFIASMSNLRGLTGINMSQPHLNNMEIIYRNTVDKGVPLLKFSRKAAEEALADGRELGGLMQC